MQVFLDLKQAAGHVGLTDKMLKGMIESGGGPPFIRPTPRKMLFTSEDLDAWAANWIKVAAPSRATK